MKGIKVLLISILTLFLSLPMIAQITEIGLASFYADKYDGRVTASGEIFDQKKMTAAHRTFPFGTKVKVTNIKNKKTITVVINDRGPFVDDRVIDLSKAGAKKLDFISAGVAQVKVEVISLGKTKSGTAKAKQSSTTGSVQSKSKKPETSTINIVENTPKSTEISKVNVEYYKINSEFISPTGYGIQIASYQEGANLMRQINDIKTSVKKDVIIQVGDNNGKKVYRVIIGTFTTREAATNFNNKLGNKFKGSYVIGF